MKIKRGHIYLSLIFAFLIGNYQGYIALWTDNCTQEPTRIFPYSVSSLPKTDQLALNQGIRIESEAELMKLLEDYLS